MKGKGLAENLQPVTFTYIIVASSVLPSNGSLAGGQIIAIRGNGFGSLLENALVFLGDSPCEMLSVNLSVIKCRTTSHAAGLVSINISIQDSSAILPGAYKYDSSLTASVSKLSPQQGSVTGGEEITFFGSGFSDRTSVQIGDKECVIKSVTDNWIACITQPQRPGKYLIRVITPGNGFAIISEGLDMFEHVFEVNRIHPLIGSVAGGTHVAFTGRGFSSNKSRILVTIRDRPCPVMSSNGTHLICETEHNFQTVLVKNTGSHPGMF